MIVYKARESMPAEENEPEFVAIHRTDSLDITVQDQKRFLREICQLIAEKFAFPDSSANVTPNPTTYLARYLKIEILILATTLQEELDALPPKLSDPTSAEQEWSRRRECAEAGGDDARRECRKAERRYHLMRAWKFLDDSCAWLREGKHIEALTACQDAYSLFLGSALAPSRLKRQEGKKARRKGRQRDEEVDQHIVCLFDEWMPEVKLGIPIELPDRTAGQVHQLAGKRVRKKIREELNLSPDAGRKRIIDVLKRAGRM